MSWFPAASVVVLMLLMSHSPIVFVSLAAHFHQHCLSSLGPQPELPRNATAYPRRRLLLGKRRALRNLPDANAAHGQVHLLVVPAVSRASVALTVRPRPFDNHRDVHDILCSPFPRVVPTERGDSHLPVRPKTAHQALAPVGCAHVVIRSSSY